MGLFKKIFKPVAKVLDKVVPNEIKPALPYLAAFAPVFGPASVQGFIGDTMLRRALVSGALNVGAQLSQEGSEGDINLLSAGLGALSGAMTTPADPITGQTSAEFFRSKMTPTGAIKDVATDTVISAPKLTGLQKATNFGLEGLAKGSEMLAAGQDAGLFSKAGLKAATIPFSTATGDVMEAEARRLNKQAIIDEALGTLDEGFSSADAAQAIRLSMLQYGFDEDEITETIASAGYKAGGRVGFRFGGIDKAIEMVEKETVEKGKEGIMMAANEDPLLVEEYNKYVFDLMEQRPNAKPMSFQDFKRMTKAGMKEGGLMDLGGKEMDLRKGGFVPIGKKEKADDVPARLSKNEFVMTADAVRAAGGGSVNKGAKRMYNLMNNLEARV